jgi:hypothetical protein
MLSNDVIQTILLYNSDLRVIKIKMNRKNIKYLFDNDRDIYKYLSAMASTTNTCLGEGIYLNTLDYLNDKGLKMEMVIEKVIEYFNKYNITLSYDHIYGILNSIIHDYNNFYLNDDYYYNGYWDDGNWYEDED